MKKASWFLMVVFIVCGVFLMGIATSTIAGGDLLITASVDEEGADETEQVDTDDDSSMNTPSEDEGYDDPQDEGYDHQTEDYDAPDADQHETEEEDAI